MSEKPEMLKWIEEVKWRSPEQVTNEMHVLVEDHVSRVNTAAAFVMKKHALTFVEAHGFIECSGHDTPECEELLDLLFAFDSLRSVESRVYMISTIASAYCWRLDEELNGLPNPWDPLLSLYKLGFTGSVDHDPEGHFVDLEFGYANGHLIRRVP